MLRFITTTMLIAFAAIPATAAPLTPVLMTRDGVHYRYTAQLKGQLVTIRGELLDSGQNIDLTLDPQGQVDGTIGMSDVTFLVPKATRDSIVASLAPATDAQLAAVR